MENMKIYNVKEYGAAADGVTNDTAVVQKLVDECNAQGGGTLVTVKLPEAQ